MTSFNSLFGRLAKHYVKIVWRPNLFHIHSHFTISVGAYSENGAWPENCDAMRILREKHLVNLKIDFCILAWRTQAKARDRVSHFAYSAAIRRIDSWKHAMQIDCHRLHSIERLFATRNHLFSFLLVLLVFVSEILRALPIRYMAKTRWQWQPLSIKLINNILHTQSKTCT